MFVLQFVFYIVFAFCILAYITFEYNLEFPLSSTIESSVYGIFMSFLCIAFVWAAGLYGKRAIMSIDPNEVIIHHKNGLKIFHMQRMDINEIYFKRRPWLLQYYVGWGRIKRRNLAQPFDRLVFSMKDHTTCVLALPLDSIFPIVDVLTQKNYPVFITDKIYKAWNIFGIRPGKKVEQDFAFIRTSIYWTMILLPLFSLMVIGVVLYLWKSMGGTY
jgi:hypothetical protein